MENQGYIRICCPNCGSVNFSASSNPNVPYVCNQCGKTFFTPEQLRGQARLNKGMTRLSAVFLVLIVVLGAVVAGVLFSVSATAGLIAAAVVFGLAALIWKAIKKHNGNTEKKIKETEDAMRRFM